MNAIGHTILTEGLVDEAFVAERCDTAAFNAWRAFIAEERNSPEALGSAIGVPAADLRAAARLLSAPGRWYESQEDAGHASTFFGSSWLVRSSPWPRRPSSPLPT